jgi:hypothetical protein
MYLRENAQGCSKKVRAGQRCGGDIWHGVPDAWPSPGSRGDHSEAATPGYLLANLRVARHLRGAGNAVFVGFLPGGEKRIESELVAVEEEGQVRYFISGNNPFGNSIF